MSSVLNIIPLSLPNISKESIKYLARNRFGLGEEAFYLIYRELNNKTHYPITGINR